MSGPGGQNRGGDAARREISVVVVNYNGGPNVLDTLDSVFLQRGVSPQVTVVDDGSTDGSPDAIAKRFPEVEIQREPRNTRNVNRLRNRGLERASADRVFVIDNDVVFDNDCFSEMLRVMDADPSVGLCIPRMMYVQDPSIIYMAGGRVHYVGATIAPHRHEPFDGREDPRPAIGGGIGLFDRRKLVQVGPFDEDYWLAWGDDVELHQRLLLAGYTCMYVPTAVCLHDYKAFDGSRRYRARGQVRNRWRYLLTHYEVRTLLLTAPALALYEIVQAAFLTAKGLPHLYVRGTLDALLELRPTLRRRRRVQALRRVPDRDLVSAGDLYVRPEHASGRRAATWAVRALSRVLDAYWRFIRPVLAGGPGRTGRRLAQRPET